MSSVLAGMAIGATIELAVGHWRDGDVAQSPAANSIAEEPSAEATAVQALRDIPAASTRPSTSAAGADDLIVTRPQALCKDAGAKGLAAEFLNPTCRPDKQHARHPAWTTYRIATLIVGRAESTPAPAAAEPMSVAAAAIESSHTVVGAGKTVTPTVARQMPLKKPKAAPSAPIVLPPPTREATQQGVGFIAFAAVPQPGSDNYERPGDIFHATAMPPSSGGLFGGIW